MDMPLETYRPHASRVSPVEDDSPSASVPQILFFCTLMILLVLFQYDLWLGKNGIHDYQMQRLEYTNLVDENSNLQSRNQALKSQLITLKTGQDGIEENARLKLGMIKNDETFFQIIPPGHEQIEE